MSAIQIGVLAVVTLVLGLFVVKPLLAPKNLPAPAAMADAAPAGAAIAGQAPPALTAADPADAIIALKEIANSKTDETALLIKSWLETAEDAA